MRGAIAKGCPNRAAPTKACSPRPRIDLARLNRRFIEVGEIDFFDAPGREAAAGLLAGLESTTASRPGSRGCDPTLASRQEIQRRTW